MAEIRIQVAEEVDRYLESAVRMGLFTNKAEIARAAIVQYMGTITLMSKGYDSEVMFSPEGRLYQVEYARGATSRGLTVVGIACSDGVLLASEMNAPSLPGTEGASSLVIAPEKITQINESVIVGTSGLVMDANLVIDSLRKAKFDTETEMVTCLRETYRPYLYKRDVRPLGVSLIVGSVLSGAHLYEVDASGAVVECRATAIGRKSEEAIKVLTSKYRAVTTEDARPLALEAIGDPKEYAISTLNMRKNRRS